MLEVKAIKNNASNAIQSTVKAARRSLRGTFVNEIVGFQHITREKLINEHTSTIAKSLFACNTCFRWDLHLFIQKSNNFKFQRRSFSLHKKPSSRQTNDDCLDNWIYFTDNTSMVIIHPSYKHVSIL